jgi:hypothetical protein
MARLARRVALTVAIVALAFWISVGTVLAATTSALGGKLRYGDSVVVPQSETVTSDLYAFAGTVTVDGTVHGDLVVAGGTLVVDGTVDGDVIATGGSINIGGTVGAVRAAGGQVTVRGTVGHDVLAASGSFTLQAGGHVGGDLIFATGVASVDGSVAGSIEGNAGRYSRSGSVGGSEHVTVNQQAPTPSVELAPGGPAADAVRQFVVVLLLAGLALWLLPASVGAAAETLRREPLLAFGGGLLGVLGFIVALLALLVGMIALAVIFGLLTLWALVGLDVLTWLLATGVLSLAFFISAAYLADGVVGLTLGRLAMGGRPIGRWAEFGLLAAGAAVVVLVTSLPVVGPWAKLLVILLGLGAILVAGWRARRRPSAPPPPAAAQLAA